MEHPASSMSHLPEMRWRVSAEAAEFMAYNADPMVVYSPRFTKEPIDDWLQGSRPSVLSSSDGIDRISVFAKDWNKTKVISDKEGLLAAWERLQASGETIDKTSITCLAKTYGKTSGKWLFFVKTGDKVDSMWAKVAKAVVSGDLCYYAKISPFDPSGSGSHVCCMYNDDFTNEDEVMALEQRIRDSGIYTTLLYKPDVYTCLGIYKQKNEWNVRPTIYESNFEVVSRQSKVITN